MIEFPIIVGILGWVSTILFYILIALIIIKAFKWAAS